MLDIDNINNYVDKVFVINMEKDKNRLNNITEKCNKFNISFERFNGVDPLELKKKDYDNDVSLFGKSFASFSMIGCGLSHLYLWRKIVNENIEKSLIFEDDVIIKDDFYNVLHNTYKELPEKWNILYLTTTFLQNINKNFIISTSGYIITLQGAKDLLKYFNNKIHYHVDVSILFLNLIYDLKIYTTTKYIVYQKFIDIQDNSNNIKINKFPYLLYNELYQYDLTFYKENDIPFIYIYYLKLINIFNIDINFNTIIIILIGIFNIYFGLIILLYDYYNNYINYDNFIKNLIFLYIGFIISIII